MGVLASGMNVPFMETSQLEPMIREKKREEHSMRGKAEAKDLLEHNPNIGVYMVPKVEVIDGRYRCTNPLSTRIDCAESNIPVDADVALGMAALLKELDKGEYASPESEGLYQAFVSIQALAVAIHYHRKRQGNMGDNSIATLAEKLGKAGQEEITVDVIEYIKGKYKDHEWVVLQKILLNNSKQEGFKKGLDLFRGVYSGARKLFKKHGASPRYSVPSVN